MLVVGGQPIREPLAWAGPFVMNTKAEVLTAYEDFQKGRLGHHPAPCTVRRRTCRRADASRRDVERPRGRAPGALGSIGVSDGT